MTQPASSPTDPDRGDGVQPITANFGDSSGPLFSLYSKVAEAEDKKMADIWQQEATDGILVFTGLFSAAVAALLTFSVQDLRPNSQDTSAFYLANIYQVLANPNVTVPRTLIPSTIATPLPFSPSRYAIWVNSLWFLSFVISLTCALLAVMLRQWARRYIKVTQPASRKIEKRARMRAFFAGGMDKMYVPLVVEGLPVMLHLSVFLFFSGLVIFLLNVNHSVYLAVIWWIGFFAVVYGCATFMPMFWSDSPYFTPLSSPISFISITILIYIISAVHLMLLCFAWIGAASYTIGCTCVEIIGHGYGAGINWDPSLPSLKLRGFFRFWRGSPLWEYVIWNAKKAAEKILSNRLSEIDLGILRWTMGTLDEDDKLEEFFDALPGFFDSKLVNVPRIDSSSTSGFYFEFQHVLNGFLYRSLVSNSVVELVKIRRFDIYTNATDVIIKPHQVYGCMWYFLASNFNQLPQSIEMASILARWSTVGEEDIARIARCRVADILGAIQNRDDSWIALATNQFDMPEDVLRNNIARGDDSVLLSIFIHMTRKVIHALPLNAEILSPLSKFNIRNTHPELQNDFRVLWNEIVLEARRKGSYSAHVRILREIRRLYIVLHQGTDAAPTSFDASTDPFDLILYQPSSYPLCNIAPYHTSRSESQPIYSQSQHRPTTSIISGLSSSPDPASPYAPEFPPSSTTTDPVHITSQATAITVPSIHESIQTVTLDINRLVSTEISHLSPKSSLSTADVTTNIVCNDSPAPYIPIHELGEVSQTPSRTLVTFPHLDPVTVTVNPSTVPHPPSVSVERQDRNMHEHEDITPSYATQDITQISSTANRNPRSIPNTGATVQRSEESSGVPPTVSDPQSFPIMMPSTPSGVSSTEHPPSVESALIQPGHLLHPLGSPPSIQTSDNSHITLQVISVLDVRVTTSVEIPSSRRHNEAGDPNPPYPMEVSLDAPQSVPSTPEDAMRAGDYQN